VKGIDPTAHPKVLARCKVLDSVTLMGTRRDLWKFTCKPVESEKDLSNPFKLKRVLPSAGRMNNVSSAYCTIGKSPPKLSEIGCLRMPRLQALFTMD
jgi:hypothetical protein